MAVEGALHLPPDAVAQECQRTLDICTMSDDLEPLATVARSLAEKKAIDEESAKKLRKSLALFRKSIDGGGPRIDLVKYNLLGGSAACAWLDHVVKDDSAEWESHAEVIKVDTDLGIVFGWAIVSQIDGKPYFDVQGDHIPEAAMLKASADFMEHSRMLGDMHENDEGGNVVFAFPMTADVAKAFGITTKTTGLMIGVKPLRKSTLEKFRDGTYTGFSIGGRRIVDDEV